MARTGKENPNATAEAKEGRVPQRQGPVPLEKRSRRAGGALARSGRGAARDLGLLLPPLLAMAYDFETPPLDLSFPGIPPYNSIAFRRASPP